jgi:hypothetical protein
MPGALPLRLRLALALLPLAALRLLLLLPLGLQCAEVPVERLARRQARVFALAGEDHARGRREAGVAQGIAGTAREPRRGCFPFFMEPPSARCAARCACRRAPRHVGGETST